MSQDQSGIASIAMEIEIAATPEAVWESLTSRIGEWWPNDFYAGGEPQSRRYVLEATPGGRMFEEWESGGGVLWGTVVCADPNRKLQVHGTSFPGWGGPSSWFGTWDLNDNNGATTLRYSESTIGRVSDKGMQEKDQGWQFVWRCLQAHVEGKPPPAWGE